MPSTYESSTACPDNDVVLGKALIFISMLQRDATSVTRY